MVVKNIVNIQENKIAFDISSTTSSLNFSFGNDDYFRISESTNRIDTTGRHFQFIASKTCIRDADVVADSTNVDFVGRISNIDNHFIRNLKDVSSDTSFTTNDGGDGYALLYNGSNNNWEPRQIGGTLQVSDALNGDNEIDIDLLDDIFKIIGTENKITTQTDDTNKTLTISLPTSVVIDNILTVGSTNLASQAVITTDGTNAIFKDSNNASQIKSGTNGNITIYSNNFTVNSDTTINGNLTVNGTQTIINTEIKLIEDPLIELGYAGTNSLSDRQDIGFFGQYDSSNYAGLYYDVADVTFKVFDELGTNYYETDLGTNGNTVTTNARAANIKAKKFITDKGDFGEVIFDSTAVSSTTSKNLKRMLIDLYGLEESGLFSGKALIYLYNENDASQSVSTLLNYNFHLVQNPAPGATDGGSGTVLKTVVELETKTESVSSYLINFNSSDNLISLTNLSSTETYRLVVKILPILSYQQNQTPIIAVGGGGGGGGESLTSVT